MFTKLKNMYSDIMYVSRITKVKKKKIRIIITVILANLVAAVDIGLILVFSAVITGSFQSENILSFVVEIFINYKFLIPLLVVFRFVFTYAQTINMKTLELEIHKNLRVHLLKEVFDKSNYSISDAYFYVNELSRRGSIKILDSNSPIQVDDTMMSLMTRYVEYQLRRHRTDRESYDELEKELGRKPLHGWSLPLI